MYTLNFMGKDYPLRYTTRAARKIGDLYRGKTAEDIGNETVGEIQEKNIKILAILADEGAAFERVFNGAKITAPTEEQLLLGIHPDSVKEITELCSAVIKKGKERTVTIEVDAQKQQKNA